MSGVKTTEGTYPADLVITAVGSVIDTCEFVKSSGIHMNEKVGGVEVNQFLETSQTGVFAVGDIAAFPFKNNQIRSEHWINSGDMGDIAALNMLGKKKPFTKTPFFWTKYFFNGV